MERRNRNKLYRFIGKRMKTFRKERGYSVSAAARCTGLSARMLIEFEAGRRQISAQQLVMIAEPYKLTCEELTDIENIRKRLRLFMYLTADEEEPAFDYDCLELDMDEYGLL